MVSEGPQYRIFQELTKIYAMQFHYLRESDQGLRVKELSEALRIYRPEDVISGPVLARKYDPDLIARLTGMLRPDEANFMLFSKDFKKFCNQREQYFGVEYKELSKQIYAFHITEGHYFDAQKLVYRFSLRMHEGPKICGCLQQFWFLCA